jgi:hypothetical protein
MECFGLIIKAVSQVIRCSLYSIPHLEILGQATVLRRRRMYLHRVTPTWDWTVGFDGKYLGFDSSDFRVSYSGYREDREKIVVAKFERFGGGEKRHSDFEVGLRWDDIEKVVNMFCEEGRPEAIAMREGRKLVEIIKGLKDEIVTQAN